jgi:hypothetical protein
LQEDAPLTADASVCERKPYVEDGAGRPKMSDVWAHRGTG